MFLLPSSKHNLSLILLSCCSALLGVLVFLHGFFLSKHSLMDVTYCSPEDSNCQIDPSFKRGVVLLIDALRFDFAEFNSSVKTKDTPHYLNKMPVFNEIINSINGNKLKIDTEFSRKIKERGGFAFLSKFVADAPTTTQQRLNALTTGSLPTYFEFIRNFGGSELKEDNIVKQLVRNNDSITVLGDNTWGSMFPKSLTRSFPYRSFNIRDLDTVDKGVMDHLDQELERRDAKLLVAHFLGVDHAGHAYGPHHQKMAQKLSQMDDVVRHVTERIDEETILFVIGDHGMTAFGDHGGDSDNEVTTGFFTYSPGLRSTTSQPPKMIPQVSFVPTLSLLLGLPIPFSNIGGVVSEMFGTREISALNVNVNQVHKYLTRYQEVGKVLPLDLRKKLSSMKRTIDELKAIKYDEVDVGILRDKYPGLVDNNYSSIEKIITDHRKKLCQNYLYMVKAMCDEVWVTFNFNEMICGIFLLLVAIVNFLCIAFSIEKSEEIIIFFNKSNFILLIVMITSLSLKLSLNLPVLDYIPAFLSGGMLPFQLSKINSIVVYSAYKEYIPITLFVLFCLGEFSDSFIVNEGAVSSYIVIALFFYQTLKIFFSHREKMFQKNLKIVKLERIQNHSLILSTVIVSLSCLAIRASLMLFRCREDQEGFCIDFGFHQPLSAVSSSIKNYHLFAGLVSLFLLGNLPRWILKHCGNLNGGKLAVILSRYSTYLFMMLIVSYWSLESITNPSELITSYKNMPPRLLYISAIAINMIIFLKPLMIFHLQRNKSQSYHTTLPFKPDLYNSLKFEYDGKLQLSVKDDSPVVYGLATSLSAPLLSVCCSVLMVIVLVIGPGLSLGILFMVTLLCSCCILHSILCWQIPTVDSILRLRWITPIMWTTISIQSFYSLGHQMTLNTIPWLAAFVGFIGEGGGGSGVGGISVPITLVTLHTYASYIFCGIALPLLLLAPISLSIILPSFRKTSKTDELRRGEFILTERPESYIGALTATSAAYLALHSIKLLFSCISCLFLRRHRMLWKVFAPHFLFQSLGLLVSMVSVWLGLFLAFRVITVMHQWASHLTLFKGKSL